MKRIGLVIACAGVLFSACKNSVADPAACYTPKVEQLLISNCTESGCHNSKDRKAGFDFTTYNGVLKGITPGHALQSELYVAMNAKSGNTMPPRGRMSDYDIATVRNWINLGAKNNYCEATVCDTTAYKFSDEIFPVMKGYCIGCHSPGSASGIDLSTYTAITACVQSGRLLGSIKHQGGYAAMPQNMQQLSTCQIRTIEKWIRAGMPEN